jgi:hypothetical protein
MKSLDFWGVAAIDIDRDHVEIRPRELGLQPVQGRHLLSAGHAPGGPQVHQDRLAAPVRQLGELAIGILEGEVRQPQGCAHHGQRGHLAMRQRRDPFRDPGRAPAGGIAARAISQHAGAVDGGKADRDPDQHGPNG